MGEAPPPDLEGGPLVTALGKATFDLPRDKPLFTFLHYFDAHAPYAPPPPFARMYYQGDERAPGAPVLDFPRSPANAAPNRAGGMYDWLAGVTDLQFPARQYAAGVSYTDDHVGQVVDELKRRGRYDDTLIILPTLLDWLDLPAAEGDGRSLRDLVEGRDPADASLLVAEQGSEPDDFSKTLIAWPLKMIYFRSPTGERCELYGLSRDPEERHDLAASRPDDVARLSARLWAQFEEQRPLGTGVASRPANLDAPAQRQLRSLGYVTGRAAREPSVSPVPDAAPRPASGPAGPGSPVRE